MLRAPFTSLALRPEPVGSIPSFPCINKKHPKGCFLFLVALIGIEPILLSELDFESSASTSSATEPERTTVTYLAAAFSASTFLTRRALRVGL